MLWKDDLPWNLCGFEIGKINILERTMDIAAFNGIWTAVNNYLDQHPETRILSARDSFPGAEWVGNIHDELNAAVSIIHPGKTNKAIYRLTQSYMGAFVKFLLSKRPDHWKFIGKDDRSANQYKKFDSQL